MQMRKNGKYIPTKQPLVHAKEVLQTMSVLTQDNRFEEAYEQNEEEPKNMCEALDIVENRGMQTGRREGRIIEYIDIRREDGYPEESILQGIITKFDLTEEQAEKYMQDEIG